MPLSVTAPQLSPLIGLFSATAPVWSRRMNSIGAGSVVIAQSPGAATLYGVNHPGLLNAGRVFRFAGDGTTTVFTLPTAATGVTYPTTNAAALTVINALEAIALTFAPQFQGNAVTRQRMGADASPSGNQWKISGTTVTFGTAPVAGQTVEIIVPDPATIVQIPGAALVANVPTTVACRSFMIAGVANVILTPAGSR